VSKLTYGGIANGQDPAARLGPSYWPKMPGFPLPLLGIVLVTVPWILPIWAIILFRREGTEVNPTSTTNRKLIINGPYRFTRNPMYLGLVPAQVTVSFPGLSNIRVRVSVLEVHIVFGKSSALVSNPAGCIQVAA